MSLDFKFIDDGILEARTASGIYTIFGNKDGLTTAAVDGKELIAGTLRQCLDACDGYDYEAVYNKLLDIDKELSGCSYIKIDKISFVDNDGHLIVTTTRAFNTIENIRKYLYELSDTHVVYVYSLREFRSHLYPDYNYILYHLKCAIKGK